MRFERGQPKGTIALSANEDVKTLKLMERKSFHHLVSSPFSRKNSVNILRSCLDLSLIFNLFAASELRPIQSLTVCNDGAKEITTGVCVCVCVCVHVCVIVCVCLLVCEFCRPTLFQIQRSANEPTQNQELFRSNPFKAVYGMDFLIPSPSLISGCGIPFFFHWSGRAAAAAAASGKSFIPFIRSRPLLETANKAPDKRGPNARGAGKAMKPIKLLLTPGS